MPKVLNYQCIIWPLAFSAQREDSVEIYETLMEINAVEIYETLMEINAIHFSICTQKENKFPLLKYDAMQPCRGVGLKAIPL